MICAVNNCSQRWDITAAPWSHENEGKKMFSLFYRRLSSEKKIGNRFPTIISHIYSWNINNLNKRMF